MRTNYSARIVRAIRETVTCAQFSDDPIERIEFLRIAGLLRDQLPRNHPAHWETPEPYEG
jgi:hypothetical protein